MLSQIQREDYGASEILKILIDVRLTRLTDRIIKTVKAKLEDVPEPWENVDFSKILHAECEHLHLSIRVFMKALRYALAGMKVGLFP